ncbi:MAG TPA: hypothetical protein VHV30_15475 [Polyangiaceae bacterium]|nr:hypothetical protein [Polyangiaceae bacterium]
MKALTHVLLSLVLTGILASVAGCASDQSPQPPTTSSKQAVENGGDGGTPAPSTGTPPPGGW